MQRLRARGAHKNWTTSVLLLSALTSCVGSVDGTDESVDLEERSEALTDTVVTRHGVSTAMREAGGRLTSAQLNLTCPERRALYSIGTVPRGQGAVAVRPPTSMTCAEFRSGMTTDGAGNSTVRIARSVRLTEACTFPRTTVIIEGSNLQLDCGGSVFTGGAPTDSSRLDHGLSFAQNSIESGQSATSLPVIREVDIVGCNFEHYEESGITIGNQFNRRNPLDQDFYHARLPRRSSVSDLDELHEVTGADEIRALSPRGISIRNLRVKYIASNMAIYIQNHVQQLAIDEVGITASKGGIYLDHGSRGVTITNSCFLDAANDDGREFIAVDASARNRIEGNLFYGNPSAAIALYKNAYESHQSRHQFPRRQPADENRILGNAIVGTHSSHKGVSIASRQWADGIKANRESNNYGDPSIPFEGGERFRDFARNNEVAGNVFFASGLAVGVQDDGNHIHDNFIYVKASKTTPTFQVGHHEDPAVQGRSIRGVELRRNWIEMQDQATRPASIRSNVVTFPGQGRPNTLFSANVFESAPMCALPFAVPSSNVPNEGCRFGSLDQPAVVVDPYRTGTISDAGRIHGRGDFRCTAGGWQALSGYCCSGTTCTRVPLTGVYQ